MSTQRIRVSRALLVSLAALVSIAVQPSVLAQSSQGTARKIVSDDFTKNRQEAGPQTTASKGWENQAPAGALSKPRPPRRTYRLASAAATVAQPKTHTAVLAQLGVTIWRLRPGNAKDTGARMLVREQNKTAEWVPERVEADTTFREGDQVRLSIESAQPGYLYVVDRDLLSNGSTGPAMLIYPWAGMHGDNHVGPGKLIDIPAQEDDPSYFTARRSSPNQSGEMLTIIVTSSPLDLPISAKPLRISSVEIANWEKLWGGLSERFEMEGGVGEAWTRQEQQAAAHTGGRQLTREDPAPQTIYRISVADNKALLVNVRLSYGR